MAMKAMRQPRWPPISAPRGKPSTEAIDQPRKTKVTARPRCSGGTSMPAQAAAWGVKMAGATTVSMRTGSRAPKLGISTERTCPAAYQSKVRASSRRRSQPATTAASNGAPRHITTAATVISWPAVATVTASDVLISLSVPGTTITPVPITKLPASSAHSAPRGAGRLTEGPSPSAAVFALGRPSGS
ncbi:hypothetical protein QFZ42_002578 [Variovorax paradoxus]|nr:hypothetical protein [Variovorax paradoxus]